MSGPMNLVYPQVGDTQDVWGVVLNALLGANGGGIEAHNHSSGQGNPIPSSALAINADVSWASSAITALKTIEFTEVAPASVTSYVDAIYVSSIDHNLYFLNNSNVPVQITEGNTLNISLVGGIGGDYSTVNALLSYNDASKNYFLQQEGSPRPWAGLETGDILLFQKAASISNAVTLKSPGSLAASYTVTWPAAVPSAQAIVQMSAGGTLTPSNTLGSNQNLQLTGSGYVQRASSIGRTHPLGAGIAAISGSFSTTGAAQFGQLTLSGSGGMTTVSIPLFGFSGEEALVSASIAVTGLTGTAPTASISKVAGGSDFTISTVATLANGVNNVTSTSATAMGGSVFLVVSFVSGASFTLGFCTTETDIP